MSRPVDAALAAAAAGPRPVEVTGSGSLAEGVRAALAGSPASARPGTGVDAAGELAGSPGAAARPGTVVETTGRVAEIERAFARVRELGTVVLAGPPPAGGAAIDLYADLHVRGLTVVALPGRGG